MSRKRIAPPTDRAARWLYDFKDIDTLKDFKRELARYRWHPSYGRLKRLVGGRCKPTREECKQIWRIRRKARREGIDPSEPGYKEVKAQWKAIKKEADREWLAKRRKTKRRPVRADHGSAEELKAQARAIKKKLQTSGKWNPDAWEELRKQMHWSVNTMWSRLGGPPSQ